MQNADCITAADILTTVVMHFNRTGHIPCAAYYASLALRA